MDFKDSPEDAAWREEVRAWLDENATKLPEGEESLVNLLGEDDENEDAFVEQSKAWQKKLYDAGYAAITWPKQFGGRDASPLQSFIFGQEMSGYDVPAGVYTIGLGMMARRS